MNLINVYQTDYACQTLYDLFLERDPSSWISTKAAPTYQEHVAFFCSRPYHSWYLIKTEVDCVGSLYHGHDNSIGVAVFNLYQRKGYATEAIRIFMSSNSPLPAIKSVRNGNFIANVAPGNAASVCFFSKLGFKKIQEVYAHDGK